MDLTQQVLELVERREAIDREIDLITHIVQREAHTTAALPRPVTTPRARPRPATAPPPKKKTWSRISTPHVLDFLAAHPGSSRKAVASALGETEARMCHKLQTLRKSGHVRQANRHWHCVHVPQAVAT